MDVTIKNGRVIFAPFTPQEDRDPYSNKPGIRAYNKFIGIILKFFGKAEEVHVLGRENKPIYINKNSFKDWCERHKFDEKIAKTLTPEAIIRDIVYLAQLSKQIKANPNGQDYFDRAIFYLNHNNLKKGQKDLDSAISESPQNLEYLETRINLLLSKKKFGHDSTKALHAAIRDCTRIIEINPNYQFSSLSDQHQESEESLESAVHLQNKEFNARPVLLVRAALYDAVHASKEEKHMGYEYEKRSFEGKPVDGNLFLEIREELNDIIRGSRPRRLEYEKSSQAMALDDCDQFIKMNPNDSEGFFFRASLQKKYKNFDAALEDLDTIIENPYIELLFKIQAMGEKAKIYLETKDYQNVLRECEKIEKESPDYFKDPEMQQLREKAKLLKDSSDSLLT